jgi:hypothetical protein
MLDEIMSSKVKWTPTAISMLQWRHNYHVIDIVDQLRSIILSYT